MGIPTVSVLGTYKIRHIKKTAVLYKSLKGITLRDYFSEKPAADRFIGNLAEFIADIHRKGVFFRSIHFANIIVLPNGTFGLIDVSDMRIKKRSLSFNMRLRNFRHFTRYEIDKQFFKPKAEIFIDIYSRLSPFSKKQHNQFKKQLYSMLEPDHSKEIENSISQGSCIKGIQNRSAVSIKDDARIKGLRKNVKQSLNRE